MTTVTGIRFKKAGKVYYFNPGNVWPQPGDSVVVETIRGIEIGETVTGSREVADDQIITPLKSVIRLATEEDLTQAEKASALEAEARKVCQEKIVEHKLDMKLIDTEIAFDISKIIFYFTSNGRVDFRDLVRDLASAFKTRIELRQVGVRDEAKMLGGLGACGRTICCGTFLGDFQPVSIKMAKEQNLSLNPTKISGQCGRLMCCLKYEQSFYEATLKKLPRVGREILTPDGPGTIAEINVLKETVKVRVRLKDGSYDVRFYPIDEVQRAAAPQSANNRESAAEQDGKRADGNGAQEPERESPPKRVRPKAVKKSAEAYFSDSDKSGESDAPEAIGDVNASNTGMDVDD